MKTLMFRGLCLPRWIVAALTLTLMFAFTTPTQAGRIGGPISARGFVAPYSSAVIPVYFTGYDIAMVVMVGSDGSELELCLFDSNFNVSLGEGTGNYQVARLYVLQPGLFYVVVRNLGPFPNAFILRTN